MTNTDEKRRIVALLPVDYKPDGLIDPLLGSHPMRAGSERLHYALNGAPGDERLFPEPYEVIMEVLGWGEYTHLVYLPYGGTALVRFAASA